MRVSHRDGVVACAVTGVTTTALSVVIVHGLAAIICAVFGGRPEAATALESTAWTLFLGAAATFFFAMRGRQAVAWLVPLVIGVSMYLASGRSSPSAAASLLVTGAAQIWIFPFVATRLDSTSGSGFRRPTFRAVSWAALAVLMLVQIARLSTFMADPTSDWWLTTREQLWAQHMCMPAYIEAADLQRQGVANVYDARQYAALVRDAKPHLTVQHLDRFAGDPFQYPPPFLLAPLAALGLTNDFLVMRTVWYAAQLVGLVCVALLLASWIGGREGGSAAWLLPLLIVSVPVMQALQYGQFHLAALLVAVGGMLAFERGHPLAGGALLSASILAKIFPGILLVLLLVQKRWREAAWTVAFTVAFTLAALMVVGTAPFHAFLTYQLPRIANGQAFAFADQWPELRLRLVVIDNLSPTGLLAKLQELGVPGLSASAGSIVRRGFDLLLVGLLLLSSRRPASRRGTAATWLALLNLGALESYAAWGDYVTLGTVWLLTLFRDQLGGSRVRTVLFVAAWVLCAAIPGAQPMPNYLPVVLAIVLTSGITIAVLVTNAWAIVAAISPGSSGTPPQGR